MRKYATGPSTLAGNLALQNAEILAGIVLAQLVREGTPVVFAGASSIAEMRSGALSIGSPEMAMNTAATAQMGRYYNLPVRGGGAVCDAKLPDSQAAYESMMSLLMAMAQVSGINFVLHSAGILDSYNCMSYEKFVIDDEMCGMVKKIKRGYEVNPDTLAFDIIKEVGPGGHFLDGMIMSPGRGRVLPRAWKRPIKSIKKFWKPMKHRSCRRMWIRIF